MLEFTLEQIRPILLTSCFASGSAGLLMIPVKKVLRLCKIKILNAIY